MTLFTKIKNTIIPFLFAGFVMYVILSLSSCKKDKLNTSSSAKLKFSADTVLFDTVFATAGSATKNIRVINPYKERIKISKIYFQSGSSSQFILNVDGSSGKSFSNIEIDPDDSLYIFIQVNVNPLSSNSPLIIQDAIIFEVNGNTQKVYLEAWGQNAYYHKPTSAIYFSGGGYLAYSTISSINNATVTWTNDKPHVIYGWLVVDSSQTLIMQSGTRVYFYQNAGLWVYRYGTLKVQGVYGNEVVFQGFRREPDFVDLPGQWDRIWINEGSKENEINYAIIKNGFIGIQAEVINSVYNADPRRLKLTNTRIFNMSKWGLYSLGYNIYAGNNIIGNCGEYNLVIALGGNYNFIHNTFANYWTNSARNKECVYINNYAGSFVFPLDTCYFGNCIIDGNLSNELNLDLNTTNSTYPPNHQFNFCLIKTNINTSNSHFTNCIINQNPKFISPYSNNFDLQTGSAAINAANNADAIKFPFDINNYSRFADISPDIGAIEKQ
ncbi:MAG TPA: choice-of-anchor Q domain-containing protein [Bacteroidia bacterium]|nr:choice-of-anchor Q domain-containing protein [Bacteroidia bacterium]